MRLEPSLESLKWPTDSSGSSYVTENVKLLLTTAECRTESQLCSFFFCMGGQTYKPTIVLFVGHRQTAQNQIRRHKMRRLIRFSTVCKHKFLLNFELKWKIPTNNPKIGNGLVQLIRMGNYFRHKWVKGGHGARWLRVFWLEIEGFSSYRQCAKKTQIKYIAVISSGARCLNFVWVFINIHTLCMQRLLLSVCAYWQTLSLRWSTMR